jgi:hypothetical protein
MNYKDKERNPWLVDKLPLSKAARYLPCFFEAARIAPIYDLFGE